MTKEELELEVTAQIELRRKVGLSVTLVYMCRKDWENINRPWRLYGLSIRPMRSYASGQVLVQ